MMIQRWRKNLINVGLTFVQNGILLKVFRFIRLRIFIILIFELLIEHYGPSGRILPVIWWVIFGPSKTVRIFEFRWKTKDLAAIVRSSKEYSCVPVCTIFTRFLSYFCCDSTVNSHQLLLHIVAAVPEKINLRFWWIFGTSIHRQFFLLTSLPAHYFLWTVNDFHFI